MVISGTFVFSSGFDPEPYGNILMDGAKVAHDMYRLTGHNPFLRIHIGNQCYEDSFYNYGRVTGH